MRYFIALVVLLVPALVAAQNDSIVAKASRREIGINHPRAEKDGTYSITITVTNIRNHDGVIRFKFYDDATPFPSKTGFRKVVVPKTQVSGDSLRVTYYGFTSKNMAIALLDDENDNCELDFGWIFPKEGYAFSDYYHARLVRPVYKDFRFLLTGDKKVVMKMRYY